MDQHVAGDLGDRNASDGCPDSAVAGDHGDGAGHQALLGNQPLDHAVRALPRCREDRAHAAPGCVGAVGRDVSGGVEDHDGLVLALGVGSDVRDEQLAGLLEGVRDPRAVHARHVALRLEDDVVPVDHQEVQAMLRRHGRPPRSTLGAATRST